MDELKECRLGINEIDEEMARLFEKRMGYAKRIAAYKKENGLPVRDPGRGGARQTASGADRRRRQDGSRNRRRACPWIWR